MNDEEIEKKFFEPHYVGCSELGEEIVGWTIYEQPDNIVVVIKMYKETERRNAITKMTELLLLRDYRRRIYIVDSEEFEREIKKYVPDESKFDNLGQQIVLYELTDLITGRFVPVSLIAFKRNKSGEDKSGATVR